MWSVEFAQMEIVWFGFLLWLIWICIVTDLGFCCCWFGFLLWLIWISVVTDLNSYCGWLGFLLWRTLCLVVTVFPFPFNQDRKFLPISWKLPKILFTKLSRWSCWWWKTIVRCVLWHEKYEIHILPTCLFKYVSHNNKCGKFFFQTTQIYSKGSHRRHTWHLQGSE